MPHPGRSKFLSLILRHDPGRIGITLDQAGWVEVDRLLAGLARAGEPMSREELEAIVMESDKQRFSISEDGLRIRANQGHSVPVELGYAPLAPPARLYHGTVARFVPAIRAEGLRKGARHDVHLTEAPSTASTVGQRRGRPVILTVRAGEMAGKGHLFFLSANGVWLTDHVPVDCIDFPVL